MWSKDFVTIDLKGNEYKAKLDIISDDPKEVIPRADIILICLPGFAIRDELKKIKPFVSEKSVIGCVFGGSGFFLQLVDIIGENAKGFALQRVPYTGRPKHYGHSATLKGYKPYLKVASVNISHTQDIVSMLQDWYSIPVYPLKHWLEATLSNSNPLLHPCRMRIMFSDWSENKVYTRIPYLYNTDWDDASSECWIKCDEELRKIMEKLPMDPNEVPSILEYYECSCTKSLTKKMQSIEPFKTVLAHMIDVDGGYTVDSSVRYFTEDIPYGLLLIKAFAQATATKTPNIDDVLYWAQRVMNKTYIVNGEIEPSVFNGELGFLSPENICKLIHIGNSHC